MGGYSINSCGAQDIRIRPWRSERKFRGSTRSQLSEHIGRATCFLAGARQTRFELSTSTLRKSSSRICASTSYPNVWSGIAGKNGFSRKSSRANLGVSSVVGWTSSVAGDALDNQRSHEHLQEYQQGVRRHLSKVQRGVQVHLVASREEVENVRDQLSQSLAEGSHSESVCEKQIWCVRRMIIKSTVETRMRSLDCSRS